MCLVLHNNCISVITPASCSDLMMGIFLLRGYVVRKRIGIIYIIIIFIEHRKFINNYTGLHFFRRAIVDKIIIIRTTINYVPIKKYISLT